jgi:hypothetical protein
MAEFPFVENYRDFDPHLSLVQFLDALNQQLFEVFDEPVGFLIPEEFYQLVRAAHDPVPAAISAMMGLIMRREINLGPHALFGAPLALKLNMVATQSRRWEETKRSARQDSNLRRPARGIFKKLLERIDIPLKSLVDSLHLGGLVVEFKEGLEHIVPDDFGETQ